MKGFRISINIVLALQMVIWVVLAILMIVIGQEEAGKGGGGGGRLLTLSPRAH